MGKTTERTLMDFIKGEHSCKTPSDLEGKDVTFHLWDDSDNETHKIQKVTINESSGTATLITSEGVEITLYKKYDSHLPSKPRKNIYNISVKKSELQTV